jgi:hypothetical protein
MSEYTILSGYEYSSPQTRLPTGKYCNCKYKTELQFKWSKMQYDVYMANIFTAPILQAFQTTDEYPLMDYNNGQPQGRSVNTNQTVSSSTVLKYSLQVFGLF